MSNLLDSIRTIFKLSAEQSAKSNQKTTLNLSFTEEDGFASWTAPSNGYVYISGKWARSVEIWDKTSGTIATSPDPENTYLVGFWVRVRKGVTYDIRADQATETTVYFSTTVAEES